MRSRMTFPDHLQESINKYVLEDCSAKSLGRFFFGSWIDLTEVESKLPQVTRATVESEGYQESIARQCKVLSIALLSRKKHLKFPSSQLNVMGWNIHQFLSVESFLLGRVNMPIGREDWKVRSVTWHESQVLVIRMAGGWQVPVGLAM